MRPSTCQRESELRRAAASGQLTAELQAHATSCASCRQALELCQLFGELAARDRPGSGLPSAGQLWWRSQVLRQLRADRGETPDPPRTIRWLHLLALSMLVAGLFFGQSRLVPFLVGSTSTTASGLWIVLLALGLFPVVLAFTALWLARREE